MAIQRQRRMDRTHSMKWLGVSKMETQLTAACSTRGLRGAAVFGPAQTAGIKMRANATEQKIFFMAFPVFTSHRLASREFDERRSNA
jgi:hypothetical protein